MKRILALNFFPAFVPPSNGGESRLFNFYKGLSRFHHVTLLTSSHLHCKEEKILHGCNFIERRIPKDHYFATMWNEFLRFSSGGDLSAVGIAACGKLPTLLHQAYLEEYERSDIIIHDSPFTVDYDLFFDVDDKLRIYNSYNCETTLYKELHPEPKSEPIWNLVKDSETKLLAGSDAVLYCNVKDLDDFEKLAPAANYRTISAPNGMSPLGDIDCRCNKDRIESIVFVGSDHPPNAEAARIVANQIAPDLPNIEFHVIGKCLPKGAYARNVIRHGFVDDEDKEKLICKADLAINPMGAGSGSNVKVFDYLSYGVPVLSTNFGMRGIDAKDGLHCIIAPVEEFPSKIEFWSSRYDALQQIGVNGKAFAEATYAWDKIAGNLSDQLFSIEKNRRWKRKFILALNDYDSFRDLGGGGVRTRGIYAAVNDWRPVVFVCFSSDETLSVRHENENTIVFQVPKTEKHLEAEKAADSLFHVSINDILAHQYSQTNPLLLSVYSVLKQLSRNIVIEHPYMASLPVLFRDRFVYSSQNNETRIKRDLLRHHPMSEALIEKASRVEQEAVEYSAAVIAVSDEDAMSFSKGVRSAGPVIVARNGATSAARPVEADVRTVGREISSENAAVFVGSAHIPNVDAGKYIVEVLAPACPSVQFHIVGSVCNSFAVNSAINVRFWGILNETMKAAVMQSCTVAINPVVTGGGSNIKLADYFANGLYVVTTPFGLRGYPDDIQSQLAVAELSDFDKALRDAFRKVGEGKAGSRPDRVRYFDTHLSMRATAANAVNLLKNLEKPKKRVLFVTYRYTDPPRGGAESMFGKLINALDQTDAYQIDVVAPEVSALNNRNRFSEEYEFDTAAGAKAGLNNVRFARFPINNEPDVAERLSAAWLAQPLYEREVYLQLMDRFERSGLAWGWGDPESGSDSKTTRWAFTSCGLHLREKSTVRLLGFAPEPIVITTKDKSGHLTKILPAQSHFDLNFAAPPGAIEITTSTEFTGTDDARPLAFQVFELYLNGQQIDLRQPLLAASVPIDDKLRFRALNEACRRVREPLGIDLTKIRGPFSEALENYLDKNVQSYDLVVTHNNIFRPPSLAVTLANKAEVPVISIPHAHLDDDYYHFPDVHRSIIQSSLVLAAPRIACDFFEEMGGNVTYVPAGIDTSENFGTDDLAAFGEVWPVDQPFILVLGRKARAKGYQRVIDAVEQLAKSTDIHLVMIGPDDDRIPVDTQCVSYLGAQSRAVVRGALMACTALVNMSTSESFGIVLLEAWMAGKPVIVNGACAAFHDLAIDQHNGLIVHSDQSLQAAISSLVDDPDLCERLAANGKEIVNDYDWSRIGSLFVRACEQLVEQNGSEPGG